MMGSLGRPETYGHDSARHPTHQGFAFPGVGLSGRYDSMTNRIVGAEITVLPKLARAAWGDDEWFAEAYLDMVPPPDVRDLRPSEDQLNAVLALQVDDFAAGDPEVVFRVSYRPLLLAAGILGKGRRA